MLSNEIKHFKLFNKNGYPQELVNKTTKLHMKNLDRIKTIGPEKCKVTLRVQFINKSTEMIEKIHLIRNMYYAANLRIVFTSNPLLTPGCKDSVSYFNKSMITYQYSYCCTESYIGLTTRQIRKRIE